MSFVNVSKFAPTSEHELIKQNWHRIDCLAKHLLKTEADNKKLIAWLNKQDGEWVQSRGSRFKQRISDRYRLYK